MSETTLETPVPANSGQFSWLGGLLFKPRRTFQAINASPKAVWLLPLLVLTVAALCEVAATGYLRQLAAQSGQVQLPPDFQYYPPEVQNQITQALAATSSPSFLYVLPGLVRVVEVWAGWLLVGGLLHLVLTLLGGRSTTASTLNLVAWAGLPLALRSLVRAAALISTRQLIQAPGISGFVSISAGGWGLFLSKILGQVDVYLLWQLFLLAVGAGTLSSLAPRKAWAGTLGTMLLLLTLQALAGYGIAQLGNLQMMRPFFF